MVKPKRSAGSAPRATDFVESLDRGLRLLQAFGERASPMTLSEIAAASRSAARDRAPHSLHAAARRLCLERRQAVCADAACADPGGRYLRANQIVAVLQPVLDQIAVAAQEISSLAVLDGDDVVFIARGSPTRMFSGGVDIGYRLPSFCTAVGRVILGRFADAELKTKLAAMKRAALTPQTITDPKRLAAAIAADRSRGYSLVDREAEPHFRSIAVPVRRYDGAIVAAINIGAHVDRISTDEMVKRFLPLLREGAEGVKARLL